MPPSKPKTATWRHAAHRHPGSGHFPARWLSVDPSPPDKWSPILADLATYPPASSLPAFSSPVNYSLSYSRCCTAGRAGLVNSRPLLSYKYQIPAPLSLLPRSLSLSASSSPCSLFQESAFSLLSLEPSVIWPLCLCGVSSPLFFGKFSGYELAFWKAFQKFEIELVSEALERWFSFLSFVTRLVSRGLHRHSMERMGCRSHAWVETAPPPLITVRRRALRELPLDTILEEGIGMAGHLLADTSNSTTDMASLGGLSNNVLHQHRPLLAVAFAQ